MFKAYLIVVLVIITGVIVASRHLPWWGAGLLVAGTLVFLFYGTIRMVKLWFRQVIRRGMEMASAALKGARVTVHVVANTPPPPSHERLIEAERAADEERERAGEEALEEDGLPDLMPHRYIAVDMTVEPADEGAAVTAPEAESDEGDAGDVTETWNPASFTLVPLDARIDPKQLRLLDFAAMQAAVAHVEHLDGDGAVMWSAPAEASEEDEDAVEPAEDGYPYQIRGPLRVRLTFGVPREMPGRAKLRYLLEEFSEIAIPPG